MNKRTLIVCISILCGLLLAVAVGVLALYSGNGSAETLPEADAVPEASARFPLLNAIPADAAMILYAKDLSDGLSFMNDSTWFAGRLFEGSGRTSFHTWTDMLKKYRRHLKNMEMAVSMHFSGDLVPLMVVKTQKLPSDSVSGVWNMIAMADSCGVYSQIISLPEDSESPLKKSCIVAFSSSEPVLKSCDRHISGGVSILGNTGCATLAASIDSPLSIFFNNGYSSGLASSFLSRRYRKYASFLKSYAEWTAISVESETDDMMKMHVTAFSYDSPAYFSEMLCRLKPAGAQYADILPSGARSAVSIQIDNVTDFLETWRKYLDGNGKLSDYQYALSLASPKGVISPEKWAKVLDVKEVCHAVVPSDDGFASILMLRLGNMDRSLLFRDGKRTGMDTLRFSSYPGLLFGRLFSCQDSMAVLVKDWVVTGHPSALSCFSQERKYERLSDRFSETGMALRKEGTAYQAYFDPAAERSSFASVFSAALSPYALKLTEGISFCPSVLSIFPGESPHAELNIARVRFDGSEAEMQMMSRDTAIVVPKGPFKVMNCGTGKTVLFFQQDNNYLVLKEEDGKGIWGVPFDAPICGAVENIDYFGNGKIQFLFASGCSLYLIDRLGRFVNPFPVSIGKEILLGPAAYDFTGANGYTVMVLHKDNTIGMYNLHGKSPEAWKGISPGEPIKSLPELLNYKGKRYWAVRTSVRTLIYDFNGGEPLWNPVGDKMIRPDAEIRIGENMTAMCRDGKERTIKLKNRDSR